MVRSARIRILIALAVFLSGAAVYRFSPGVRHETSRVLVLLREADLIPLRDYLLSFGAWAPVIAVALHIGTSLVAPLPSFVPTFASAMVFGWIPGAALSWAASLFASGLCFVIARAYGRPVVTLVVPKAALQPMDRFFRRWGQYSILIARLTPFMSFDFISYGAGLTSMRLASFLVYTAVGMIPGALAFSYLADRGTTSVLWLMYMFAAAALVAAVAIAVRSWLQRRSRRCRPPCWGIPLTHRW